MTKLQQIVNKAKQMRKAHPKKYAKWTDYIKAASKSLSGLDSVKRSGNKTTVNYTRSKVATKKKAAPKKVVQAKLFGVKKTAPKKKAATHKDTKSHNVNIRVISGIDDFFIKQLQVYTHKIKAYEKAILEDRDRIKKATSISHKNFFKEGIKRKKSTIADFKKQITLIKKSIK